MTKYRHPKAGLCLVLVLMCALFPKPSRAAGDDRPIRLFATAESGPIGKAYSLGAFVIDGRTAYGEIAIWGGELIETAASSSVNIEIEAAGRITLKNQAIARLAATGFRRSEAGVHRLLVASLFEGDMAVRLQQGATAYIESCGSEFTSSIGARFEISTRNGRAFLDTVTGSVEIQTSRRPLIKARTVRLGINRPIPIATTPIQRKTGQSAQASTQWLKYYDRTSGQTFSTAPNIVLAGYTPSQTTQNEEPVQNRTVRFRLEPPTLGVITPERQTDAQGIVIADFTAANTQGQGFIVAAIDQVGDPPGTTYEEYRRPVRVTRLFWTKTKLFLAASAMAVVVTCAAACGKGKPPLQQAPPPNLP